MSEAVFSEWALRILLTGLVVWIGLIIYKMGKESKAGKFGMLIMFIALGAGVIGFVAKGALTYFIGK